MCTEKLTDLGPEYHVEPIKRLLGSFWDDESAEEFIKTVEDNAIAIIEFAGPEPMRWSIERILGFPVVFVECERWQWQFARLLYLFFVRLTVFGPVHVYGESPRGAGIAEPATESAD